jgi:hypothetical protein
MLRQSDSELFTVKPRPTLATLDVENNVLNFFSAYEKKKKKKKRKNRALKIIASSMYTS